MFASIVRWKIPMRPLPCLYLVILLGLAEPIFAQAPPAGGNIKFVMPAVGTGGRKNVPGDDYFAAFSSYYSGDYRSALSDFQSAGKGGIRSTEGRWVDSICYNSMIGECAYQMGDFGSSLEAHTAALKLYLAHQDWMLRIEFPPTIEPANGAMRNPITWGASERKVVLGRYPDTIHSFQGRANNQKALTEGGVVAAPQFYPLHVIEIVRCIALSIRRRNELMGPVCPHDPLTNQIIEALSRRQTTPNHWSQTLIDLQLGLALFGGGRLAPAASELQNSLLAAGQFEHPLTCMGLVELGKISFLAGQYENAAKYFLEATFSAAAYQQFDIMEEAFRGGLITHLVSGRKDFYAPLLPAAMWARKNSVLLEGSLYTLAAENFTAMGETNRASAMLSEARRAFARHDVQVGGGGARLQFQVAWLNFLTGNLNAGNSALNDALTFLKKGGSHRLFQIVLADNYYTQGIVTERVADLLYSDVLREPTPTDWTVEPMETMGAQMSPSQMPMEHWFEVALKRKDSEKALQISDRVKRLRFFSTLPLGGRLLALRWVLEAPAESLPAHVVLQRQDLLAKYAKYADIAQQATELRTAIARGPLVPVADEDAKSQTERFEKLTKLNALQELALHTMALGRNAADFVFPPLRDIKEMQQRMPKGQLLLTYYNGSSFLCGFAISHDKYAMWQIDQPAKLRSDLALMLKSMGHVDKNKALEAKVLRDDNWEKIAHRLLPSLTNNTKSEMWRQFDELVVVPDGPLWYCPFEALPAGDTDDAPPLITKLRIRYAPTAGLAVGDGRHAKPDPKTAVVAGKLFPKDEMAIATDAADDLAKVLPDVTRLLPKPIAPSGLLVKFFDRLVVYHDVDEPDRLPYDWSPAQVDKNKPGTSLGYWSTFPWGGPEQVILPGFHTNAETGIKKTGSTGDEIFLTICGLMSSGTRTILLSRWRVGGQSSYDLTREFIQELPHASAAAAWQRSVELRTQATLDTTYEPRLKLAASDDIPKATHPFFWSGYLLVDTGAAPRPPADDAAKEKEKEIAAPKAPKEKAPPAAFAPLAPGKAEAK